MVCPVIRETWLENQEGVLERARAKQQAGEKLVVSGDGQYDSAGKSAMFGCYSMVNEKTGELMAYSMQQKQPGTSSYSLEAAGFNDCIEQFIRWGIRIDIFVTDRHSQVKTT